MHRERHDSHLDVNSGREASVFEFVEGPAQPKLTKKMQFLLQATQLGMVGG